MEAVSTAVPEMIADIAPAVLPVADRPYVRAAFLGLVFAAAFSASFVAGFFWLGPWLEQLRALM